MFPAMFLISHAFLWIVHPPLFNWVCQYFIVLQTHQLNSVTSYGRHRGKPVWRWFLPVPDPPNRWNTLHCLYWARPLHTHKASISVSSLLKTQPSVPFLWHDTYYCKVGVETWGSSTGDPRSDPPGRASSRKDSGYLHRAQTQQSWD